jgi:hypothetical protein
MKKGEMARKIRDKNVSFVEKKATSTRKKTPHSQPILDF